MVGPDAFAGFIGGRLLRPCADAKIVAQIDARRLEEQLAALVAVDHQIAPFTAFGPNLHVDVEPVGTAQRRHIGALLARPRHA